MIRMRLVALDMMAPEDHTFGEHRRLLTERCAQFTAGGIALSFDAPASADPAERARLAADADYWLVIETPATRNLIAAAHGLRFIQKLGSGMERLDLVSATERGIPVAVVPHFGCVAVAEHVLLLMLALGKDLVRLHHRVAHAENPRGLSPIYTTQEQRYFNYLGLPDEAFTQLYGKTLGIVGLGEIGVELARRARAFEMRVLYLKRTRLAPEREQALGVEFASLPELLRGADFVSINARHTAETNPLIGLRELRTMKRSAFLVNTARGNIVDEGALVKVLREGSIAGAGLDVYSIEPPAPDNPLLALPNVILSPHVAARGPVAARYTRLFDNLTALAEGRPPEGLVNPEVFA